MLYVKSGTELSVGWEETMKLGLMAIAAATLLSAGSAKAEVYADDLKRCMVASTSPEDRLAFVRWLFGATADHPAVSDFSNVTETHRQEATTTTARLIERLVLKDCRPQAILALRYEGFAAVEEAFGAVGEIAMGDLMADEGVAAELDKLGTETDEARWQALATEAGGRALR